MKLFSLFLIVVALGACGGKDDPEPTVAEEQFEKLNGIIWEAVTVTRDGNVVTEDFTNFTIVFLGTLNAEKTNVNGSYTTTNGGDVFRSGTWRFAENNVTNQIIRFVDGLEIPTSYRFPTEGTLELSFTFTGSTNGRTKILDGDYVFTLTEQ